MKEKTTEIYWIKILIPLKSQKIIVHKLRINVLFF